MSYCNARQRKQEQITALRGKNPISFDELLELQPMTIGVMRDNIARIFPLILIKVNQGMSIKALEAYLGLNERVLVDYLVRRPRLDKAVRKARKIKRDIKIAR